MQYLKQNALIFITLVGLGLVISSPAKADATNNEASRPYFKGPTSTCLSHINLRVYHCVFLSPPAYQIFPTSRILSAATVPDLPLDSGTHDNNWLEDIKSGEYWNKWHLSRPLQGMNMDFSLDQSGEGVNMDLGPLKFNVLPKDGNISESRFLLGIERSW
jgi:hypothetical protein